MTGDDALDEARTAESANARRNGSPISPVTTETPLSTDTAATPIADALPAMADRAPIEEPPAPVMALALPAMSPSVATEEFPDDADADPAISPRVTALVPSATVAAVISMLNSDP